MFIQVLSDLHLESCSYTIKLHPSADVLVLAGDSCPYGYIGRLKNMIKDIKIPIIAILGNHEYYHTGTYPGKVGMTREKVVEMFKAISTKYPNFHLLNDEFVDIGDVRFLGTTLWSDLESRNSRQLPLDALKIRIGASIMDFIDPTDWTVDSMIKHQKVAVDFILKMKSPTLKNVVVSHFVPSKLAIHEKYHGDILNCYFVNDLDNMIHDSSINTWIFGHTHSSFDFMLDKTHMVCNPRGYSYGYSENDEFDSQKLIEV